MDKLAGKTILVIEDEYLVALMAADMLQAMSPGERAESVENGAITVKCEYCSSVYTFSPGEFDDA
mgnify:CR=1 FL=1